MSGKFIVLEGIDGSGKNTQTELLKQYFINKDFSVESIQFPAYEETFFGNEVGRFLDGKYGSLNQVHPKLAAILYAGDRYEMRDRILNNLLNNELLLCDRYVSSNIAHQSSKYKDQEKRNSFISWVERLEYNVFKMPKPQLTIFLDLAPIYSKKLVHTKKPRSYTIKKEDIQEGNIKYMEEVYSIYKQLSNADDWRTVNCYHKNEDRIRTIQEISIDIISIIEKFFK